MFELRFGLRRRPFRPIPDTDSYFPAASHEDALRRLRRALDADEGIMLLTGDPGSGKTLIARKLLESLDDNVRAVLLTNSHVTRNGDLLQAILFDLGLQYQGLTEQVARLAVTESCLEFYRGGGKTLIVIDEAQHLHPDVLEELRLLSNLEGNNGKAVQILLVALPDIERAIDMPSLAAFRQRLTVRARLELLDPSESAEYLIHQVKEAGGRPEWIFGDDVLDILTHAANGNPRILNQVAHAAFSLADEAEQGQVDAEAAVEAVTRLGLDPEADAETLATDEDSVRLMPPRPTTVIEEVAPTPLPEPARPTIPFTPVILPIENGPPTYVYGDEVIDEAELKAPARGPSDRVG
jgi:type II secretory pathway predicted ATPase ExeA